MKKIHFPFAVLAALVLPLSAMATTETVDGLTWTYTVSGGRATLGNGYSSPAVPTSTSGAISLPATLGGYPVTSIDVFAFRDCSRLTSVTIPDSVTSIGYNAFENCLALTNVAIGNGVTSIGVDAFSGCNSLEAFSVAEGNQTYKAISGLLLTKDGKTLVLGLNGAVVIPDGVRRVGSYAFSGCSGLTSVAIPDSVTSIGRDAFSRCIGLTSIMFPDSVTSIEGYAFRSCSGLTNVVLPDSVTNVARYAFSGCVGLAKSDCVIIQGVLYGYTRQYNGSLWGVSIPAGVTRIADYAFADCDHLDGVTIPVGVTSIGDYAFSNCRYLKNVTISEGVTNIGDYAFASCDNLSYITIPESVSSMGSHTFDGCSHLWQVVFLGDVPQGLSDTSPIGSRVTFPLEYGKEWFWYFASFRRASADWSYETSSRKAEILSVQMRATDPTIMDVIYKVTSTNETENVRALAFEDGERSFAKVVRPETFVEGTGSNLGDGIAANVEHTISWRISADWAADLAKVNFEILLSDAGQLPVELVTIPATESHAEVTINVCRPRGEWLFNALLWHYADHAEGLSVVDGELKHGETLLAKNDGPVDATDPIAYVYDKMGYDLLAGDELEYARMATRWSLSTNGPGMAWTYGRHYVSGTGYVTEWYQKDGNPAYLQFGILRKDGE